MIDITEISPASAAQLPGAKLTSAADEHQNQLPKTTNASISKKVPTKGMPAGKAPAKQQSKTKAIAPKILSPKSERALDVEQEVANEEQSSIDEVQISRQKTDAEEVKTNQQAAQIQSKKEAPTKTSGPKAEINEHTSQPQIAAISVPDNQTPLKEGQESDMPYFKPDKLVSQQSLGRAKQSNAKAGMTLP